MKADPRRIKGLEMAKRNAQIKANRQQRAFYVFPTKKRGVFLVDSAIIFAEKTHGTGDAIFTAIPEV